MDTATALPLLQTKPRTRLASALVMFAVLLAFAWAVAWHIELPGLYMDAVNPDYMVVDLINGPADASPTWYLPGNMLAGRIPLLTSFYHGTSQVWYALPFVALFGANIVALRAAQAMLGAAILVLMFVLLRRHLRNESPWLAALPVLALALDPVFVYAFRTQLYIQLCAVAWLLAAIVAAERALRPTANEGHSIVQRRWWLLLAGFCFGLSVYGYFIFAFFAPVLVGAVVIACRRGDAQGRALPIVRVGAWLGLGAAIGASGYFYGYYRLASAQGGLNGFRDFFAQYEQSLGAFEKHLPLAETPRYFATLISRVFSNEWQHSLMFQESWAEPGSAIKLLLLLVMPLLIWLICEMRGVRVWQLRLVIALLLCFPLVALLFGDRLSGHHFVVLLPLAYLALALGLASLAPPTRWRPPLQFGVAVLWLAFAGMNLIGLRATGAELLQTHGRGLFSDAINRMAGDAMAQETQDNRQLYFFPDWGLFMPFHFLTDGKVRHWTDLNIENMHRYLCDGQSLSIALVSGDVPARFAELTTQLEWTPPVLLPYRDHEGHTVFSIGRFDASARANLPATICAKDH